jgi:sensor histidine kinase YesM
MNWFSKLKIYFIILILFNTYILKATYIWEKVVLQQSENVTSFYGLILYNNHLPYCTTDKGVFYYNGNSFEPIQETFSKDYITIEQINNKIYCLPYNGNLLEISPASITKGYNLNTYALNNPMRLFNPYFYNNKMFFSNVNFKNNSLDLISIDSNKLKSEKQNYINLPNLFLKTLFQGVSNITDNFKHQIETEAQNQTNTSLRIIANTYFTVKNKVFIKTNNTISLIFDGNKYNLKGTIIDFNFNKKNNQYCIGMLGESKGAYTFKDNIITCFYCLDDVTGFKQDTYGNYWMSTFNNGIFKLKSSIHNAIVIPFKNELVVDKLLPYINNTYLLNSTNGDLINFNANTQNYKTVIKNDNKEITKSSLRKTSEFDFYFLNNKNFIGLSTFTNQTVSKKMSAEIYTRKWKVVENRNHFILVAKNEILLYNKSTNIIAENFVYYAYDHISALLNDACNYNDDTTLLATNDGLLYFVSKDTFPVSKPLNNYFKNLKMISNFYFFNKKIYFKTDNTLFKITSLSEAPTPIFKFPENDIMPIEIFTSDEKIFYYLTFKNLHIIDVVKNVSKSIDLPAAYAEKMRGLFINNENLELYSSTNLYRLPIIDLVDFDCKIKINTKQILLNNNQLKYTIDSNINIKYQSKLDLKILLNIENIEKNEIDSLVYLTLNHQGDTITKKVLQHNEILMEQLAPEKYKIIIYFKNTILKTFTVNIIPKWYQTLWAKLLIILSIIAAFITGTTAIVKRRNKKYNERLLSQIYVQDLEHLSSLNQLEPHFVFNALEPLRNYIFKNQKHESLDYLNNFSVLLRTMMELSRQKWVTIEKESSFINKYLNIQQIKLGNKFEYEIKTIGFENTTQKIPAMIVQPFVENAIKYGLTNLENKIIVSFEKHTNEIIIKINDTGNGFENEKDTLKKDHAVYIIKERLRMMSENKSEKTNLQFKKETNYFTVIIALPIYNLPKD